MLNNIELNGSKWDIFEETQDAMKRLSKTEDEEAYLQGYTIYNTQQIFIDNNVKNKERVLIHEITHAWLDSYGHNQFWGKTFSNEDVCEIVAAIYPVLHKYMKENNKE